MRVRLARRKCLIRAEKSPWQVDMGGLMGKGCQGTGRARPPGLKRGVPFDLGAEPQEKEEKQASRQGRAKQQQPPHPPKRRPPRAAVTVS